MDPPRVPAGRRRRADAGGGLLALRPARRRSRGGGRRGLPPQRLADRPPRRERDDRRRQVRDGTGGVHVAAGDRRRRAGRGLEARRGRGRPGGRRVQGPPLRHAGHRGEHERQAPVRGAAEGRGGGPVHARRGGGEALGGAGGRVRHRGGRRHPHPVRPHGGLWRPERRSRATAGPRGAAAEEEGGLPPHRHAAGARRQPGQGERRRSLRPRRAPAGDALRGACAPAGLRCEGPFARPRGGAEGPGRGGRHCARSRRRGLGAHPRGGVEGARSARGAVGPGDGLQRSATGRSARASPPTLAGRASPPAPRAIRRVPSLPPRSGSRRATFSPTWPTPRWSR